MKIIESFALIRDNRRSLRPVIERLFQFEVYELESVPSDTGTLVARLKARFHELGITPFDPALLAIKPELEARNVIGQLFTGTALLLQRSAGHRVAASGCIVENNPRRIRAFYEYEYQHVGERAGELALQLLRDVLPALDPDPQADELSQPLAELITAFRENAVQHVLPLDSEVMIEEALRLNIPCFKLDREPFDQAPAESRIRPNSALRLGQARRQHIVDGNFCVDRCQPLRPYLKDRRQIARLLRELGLPGPRSDAEFVSCSSATRARRSASRMGYPVVMKSELKLAGKGVITGITDDTQLLRAYETLSAHGRGVYLEKQAAGDVFRILVAAGKVIGIVQLAGEKGGNRDVTDIAHHTIVDRVSAVVGALDTGMLVLTLLVADIARPLDEARSAFVDIDLAPALDVFVPAGSTLMAEAARGFLNWLFPAGSASRIPLIAITGTNGKTTTSRLIHRVAMSAGFTSGLACSDGVYLNGKLVRKGDLSGWAGHFLVLGLADIDFAVLETARGAVAKHGIAFDKCDVAICTNVTEDHLEEAGIETVEQMAELKRSVLERARTAIVLNADDQRCVDMLPQLQGRRLFLVSTRVPCRTLRDTYGDQYGFCCLEDINGESWLTLYEKDHREPIAPVDRLPLTLQGKADYNISNALHACAACHLAGISSATICSALSGFEMNFEDTPGRLNFYNGRPFRIVLDYAHNPAGITAFVDFINHEQVAGHRIVAFSAASYNPVDLIKGNARAVAGHFDYYICYNFGTNIQKNDFTVPPLLKQSLIENGVPAERILIADDGLLAVDEIDRLAGEGDLVAFLSGHSNRAEIWAQLTRIPA
ncbi:MAG: Mur ligase family protein [Halieaceae bacterium]|jgi:UDP-N-acetylmuramate-alanine ligase|nr:Mur ligase family protein [Halieaceae bacterium]